MKPSLSFPVILPSKFGMAVVLAASLAAALPLRAQDPEPPGAQSDFVLINGSPAFPPLVDGQSQFVPAFAPAPGIPDRAVLLFQDPGITVVSDQIYVFNQQFYFASDPDLQNLQTLGIPVVGMVAETGAPQDVSLSFGLPPNSVTVQSDLVPEPSTFVLVSLGALAIVWCSRRKHASG